NELSYLRTDIHDNAGVPFYHHFYSCDKCGYEISDMYARYQETEIDFHLCLSCGFIEGKIPEEEFISLSGIGVMNAHAGVNPDGEIQIWIGSKTPPWERSDKQERNTPKYKEWRKSVFERDHYTCQRCGKIGGELNAHHIKRFAIYKDLRYELSNGITLCVECHRREHRKNK
ncbi:HNH endonuclease, partial [Oceanobacillus sp. J11TS1]|uniref:HNH endonuclease n=1 Tax=Oceanobacillus sp. J11TS1 TaxID=2807191 RepID=UPI001BB3A01A